MRLTRVASVLLLAAAIVAGCTTTSAGTSATSGATNSATARVELAVFGAASLRDVLAAVGTAYSAVAPGTTLTVATDSSSTLRAQIEQGAPADVFLSADRDNPEALVDEGLTAGDAVDFARNALTIITPKDNPAGLEHPSDLGRPGVKIIAAGNDVPITRYANRVVANLAGTGGEAAGFAAAYASNIVSREENARAIVAKIELGEGDAAIVYQTDARTSTQVATIELPPEANVTAVYAGVVLKSSAHPIEARAFLDWLGGPAGTAILAGFGFLPPA